MSGTSKCSLAINDVDPLMAMGNSQAIWTPNSDLLGDYLLSKHKYKGFAMVEKMVRPGERNGDEEIVREFTEVQLHDQLSETIRGCPVLLSDSSLRS